MISAVRRRPRSTCGITLLVGLVALTLPMRAIAFEWGGSLSTTSTVQSIPENSDDDAFLNSERLVLYLTTGIGSQWEFVSQVAAIYDSEPVLAADLEKLYFQRNRVFESDSPQPSGLVGMKTRYGRFLMSEPTGLVMSHPVDGAAFVLDYVGFELFTGLGYTGLINKEFSRASMSLSDSLDGDDDDVYFGAPRLLGTIRLSLPEIVLDQSIDLAFVIQDDLRNPDDVVEVDAEPIDVEESGGLVDTQYGILQIGGPIRVVPGLFYSVAYVLNLGQTLSLVEDDKADTGQSYQYQPFRAHLINGSIDYFIPEFLSSVISLGTTFTSGDSDYTTFIEGNTKGPATQFLAITPSGSGLVYGLEPGNSTVTELSYSIKPLTGIGVEALSSLQTEVSYYSFFRSVGEGPVSASDVDPEEDGTYLGSEIDLALRLRPFSDLGIGVSGGMFFANNAVTYDDANSSDWIIRLNASLSF